MKKYNKNFVNTLKPAETYTHTHTHTHTHTGKPCIAFFVAVFISMAQCFASGISATGGVAQPSTCDTNTLETSTGPAKLRAEFTPEVINLRWYNDDTRINVPTASSTCTYDTAISLPTNPTKPGYKFAGWDVIPGIPVEYLQSTGRQKINTGIYANENTAIGTKFINTSSQDPFTTKMIIADSDLSSSYMLGVNEVTLARSAIGDLTILRRDYWQTNQEYTVYMDKDTGQTVNGVTTQWAGTLTPFTSSSQLMIFGSTDTGRYGIAKLFYLKIWQNGTLVRDFIPIKDADSVPCMYDFVSKQKFYNAGTGDFIAGPDL